jgi:hypothetical protein
MKNVVYTILFLILTTFLWSKQVYKKQVYINNKIDKNVFAKDSGYIVKKDGVSLLLKLNANDTIDLDFRKLNDNDTIGKFYKKENSENYYACLTDIINAKYYPSHFILELNANGEILKKERYINGFYLCCWKNEFEGFTKLNDFYIFKTCSTGSGFCSSEIYVFKEITSQENLNPILLNMSLGMCEPYKNKFLSCKLTSRIEAKPNSLVLHYKYDKGVFAKSKKFKTKMTENFDVEYVTKDNNWTALDSTKLNQITH